MVVERNEAMKPLARTDLGRSPDEWESLREWVVSWNATWLLARRRRLGHMRCHLWDDADCGQASVVFFEVEHVHSACQEHRVGLGQAFEAPG